MIDSFEKGDIYFLLSPLKCVFAQNIPTDTLDMGFHKSRQQQQAGWLPALHARSHDDAPITNDEPTSYFVLTSS